MSLDHLLWIVWIVGGLAAVWATVRLVDQDDEETR